MNTADLSQGDEGAVCELTKFVSQPKQLNKPFKCFITCLLLMIAKESTAQINLIYNGDFELYDTCPVSISTPGDYQIEHCLGWKSPTEATSDYFNTCASWPVSVPANITGYQYSFSGSGYCGILNAYTGLPFSTYGFNHEYIQGKITIPLEQGKEYEFSCKVVLSDLMHEFAYWKFGAYFSANAISQNDGKPFYGITPQVINAQNNFLLDTINWIDFRGRFFAAGGEQFITIGFFSDTLALDTLRFDSTPVDLNNFAAYYYIDDCRLYETGKEFQNSNVFSPNGDGVNDIWVVGNLQEGESVQIFDRWGVFVKELSAQFSEWDGRTTSGQECSEGVYYYILMSRTEKNNNTIKGFIQLLR